MKKLPLLTLSLISTLASQALAQEPAEIFRDPSAPLEARVSDLISREGAKS
jgi:hypothetical protein